jgi:hypothetical protein
LRCGLSLVLKMYELLRSGPALGQVLLKTVEHGHHRRVLIAQTLNQMDDESAAQLFTLLPTFSDNREKVFG